jgi:hypothetical protein
MAMNRQKSTTVCSNCGGPTALAGCIPDIFSKTEYSFHRCASCNTVTITWSKPKVSARSGPAAEAEAWT